MKRALAWLGAMVLSFAGLVGLSTASQAFVPGINIDLLHNGVVIGEDAVVPEGDDLLLRVQYDADNDIAGEIITITVPDGITVPGNLPNNEAIESMTQDGNTITVVFKDPLPDDVTEGAFGINLNAGPVDGDTPVDIGWSIGDENGGVTIIVEDDFEPLAPIEDSYNKSVNPSNLNSYVLRGDAPDYEFLGLNPSIANQVITYTLVLGSSEARAGYEITDELAPGLGFIADSFEATLTTVDGEVPFTFDPTPTGNTFSETVDVPEQSTLRITYDVQVTDIAALEALLQAQFDGRNGTPGNYYIDLPNDASFGTDAERSVNVRIQGNIPGPCPTCNGNFDKNGDWTLKNVITDEDGNLTPPAEMTYTFSANLTIWDGRNANYTLNDNVVISDALIAQASWRSGDADFITVTGDGPIQGLTLATGFTGTAADFADDAFVGRYALVDNTLLINIGKDNATQIEIAVKAQLNTIAGLTSSDDTTVIDGTRYPWNNRAQFYYGGNPLNRDHNAGVVDLPDERDGGVNDYAVFNKTGPSGDIRVNPGQAAQVPYRFTIDTSTEGVNSDGIDPLNARVVDEINTEIFDISDLDATVTVSGSYAGTDLAAEHFVLSVDDEDRLVIELSDAGKTVVEGLPEGGMWIIDILLTTVPFEGKETFEIYNRATLYGDGEEADYWSDDDSEATSYGDEAELRKRVHDDAALAWVQNLNAELVDGELVNDTFVYYIELIPRGNYGSAFPVQIFTREDILPEAVEFLGFVEVDDDEVPLLDTVGNGPVDLPGNVRASYADGVVTIEQIEGTNLNPSQGRVVTYFAVRVIDPSQPIVNQIVGSEAVITPVGDPSIDIEKWNVETEGEGPEYDETGALLNDGYDGDFDAAPGKALAAGEPTEIFFTISNDGREDLVDVVVSDETTVGDEVVQALTCDFSPLGGPESGTTWEGPFLIGDQFECTGLLPAMLSGDIHSNTAAVTGIGIETGEVVDDEDEWNAWVPEPSIDIEKWNDEGETPLYDETGALTNDGYEGDFDAAPGKPLREGEPLPINFTISNDGEEPLIDVVVSDELTGGVGVVADLVCVFPDGTTGTEWAGPFDVATQFECTGLLPALSQGESHANLSAVTGIGLYSGIEVDDEDPWHGHVPGPSIGIEKWNYEGVEPEYDEAGVLLNDGYDGDFDGDNAKVLEADKSLRIYFTITNDGEEDLVDVVVSDELTDGTGEIQNLVCEFPDGSTGTEWGGLFEVGTQFECTGLLPGLAAGAEHSNLASVTGVGVHSGIQVDDDDEWNAYVPESDDLSVTGTDMKFLLIAVPLLLLTGGVALMYTRRRELEV